MHNHLSVSLVTPLCVPRIFTFLPASGRVSHPAFLWRGAFLRAEGPTYLSPVPRHWVVCTRNPFHSAEGLCVGEAEAPITIDAGGPDIPKEFPAALYSGFFALTWVHYCSPCLRPAFPLFPLPKIQARLSAHISRAQRLRLPNWQVSSPSCSCCILVAEPI